MCLTSTMVDSRISSRLRIFCGDRVNFPQLWCPIDEPLGGHANITAKFYIWPYNGGAVSSSFLLAHHAPAVFRPLLQRGVLIVQWECPGSHTVTAKYIDNTYEYVPTTPARTCSLTSRDSDRQSSTVHQRIRLINHSSFSLTTQNLGTSLIPHHTPVYSTGASDHLTSPSPN